MNNEGDGKFIARILESREYSLTWGGLRPIFLLVLSSFFFKSIIQISFDRNSYQYVPVNLHFVFINIKYKIINNNEGV